MWELLSLRTSWNSSLFFPSSDLIVHSVSIYDKKTKDCERSGSSQHINCSTAGCSHLWYLPAFIPSFFHYVVTVGLWWGMGQGLRSVGWVGRQDGTAKFSARLWVKVTYLSCLFTLSPKKKPLPSSRLLRIASNLPSRSGRVVKKNFVISST